MKWLQEILSQELIHAIGWTLIHSIWQGSFIALALGILFWILHRQSAQVRYFLALTAMLLMFIMSVGTFIYFFEKQAGSDLSAPPMGLEVLPDQHEAWVEVTPYPQVSDTPSASVTSSNSWSEITAYFHRHLPMIVILWLMGVVVLLLKLIGGIAYVQRLKNYKTNPVKETWQKQVNILAKRLQVSKSIQLMESAMVKTPMVIGHLKPVILLPVGVLTGLPSAQIEMILAHELAHIRRHDYLINILQKLVELLFFYHPAVWWLSAMVRTEREHCCDDVAVGVGGDSLTFAKALASIQEISTSHPVVAMTFVGNKKSVLARVNRLLKGSPIEFSATEGFIMAGILFFSIFLVNLNANARLEPHEAVEFMGGGIENTRMVNSDVNSQETKPDSSAEALLEKPDTTILPTEIQTNPAPDPNPDVFIDVIPPDSISPRVSIMSNGKTLKVMGADMYSPHIVQIDSLIQGIMATPSAITLTPFLADTIIREHLRIRPSQPPAIALASNFGLRGGYVPIAERFHNVTGTFTINYEEEDRKYKTITLTTEKGKVTSLEVNGEKINAIAIDAMIAEIDREGRKFAGNQFMYQFPNEDNAFWNFGGDSTFHWNGEELFELNSEWEKKFEEQMKLQEEQMERNLENLRQLQENTLERQERQERQQQMMEERMRENEARMHEQKLRIQAQREEHQRQDEIIIDELFRDKLIESKDEVKLEITQEKMVVNGKEQPDEILEKYIDLIEDIKGIEIGKDTDFTLSYSADKK